MARNTSITIGDHFHHFVSEQVRSGRYGSTSDVVRAGLRLLEEHEARLRALNDPLPMGGRNPGFDADLSSAHD
ncbi:type II toxin-antitoxin system ParD family antitoxin (plasmid) [Sphingobium limneticum]|jgi:antitoxin ParD1/3/4